VLAGWRAVNAAGLPCCDVARSSIAPAVPRRCLRPRYRTWRSVELLYLPQPAQLLRRLLGEMDMRSARAVPAVPLYTRMGHWLCTTFERAGVETEMGSRLYATFLQAGLPAPELHSAGHVGGAEHAELYDLLADTLRSLQPLTEKFGIATREEQELDTFASRLRAQVAAGGGGIHAPSYVGAWARTAH